MKSWSAISRWVSPSAAESQHGDLPARRALAELGDVPGGGQAMPEMPGSSVQGSRVWKPIQDGVGQVEALGLGGCVSECVARAACSR